MTAFDHNRLLGIFYTVLGGLIGLGGLALMALPFILTPANPSANTEDSKQVLIVFGIVVLIIGLLAVSVGVGVLQQRSWARIGSIVMGILFLVNFPIGMALGVYTLIFMFSERGKQLYSNPHFRETW